MEDYSLLSKAFFPWYEHFLFIPDTNHFVEYVGGLI